MSISHFVLALAILSTAASAADGPAGSVAPYEIKKRSTCNLSEINRPPFWPIGWVKRATGSAPAAAAAKVALNENNFLVTSILLGNPSLAVINGRSYSEGEFVRMPKNPGAPRVPPGQRIRVQRIQDGAVLLAYENQILTAQLRRSDLVPKKFTELIEEQE